MVHSKITMSTNPYNCYRITVHNLMNSMTHVVQSYHSVLYLREDSLTIKSGTKQLKSFIYISWRTSKTIPLISHLDTLQYHFSFFSLIPLHFAAAPVSPTYKNLSSKNTLP